MLYKKITALLLSVTLLLCLQPAISASDLSGNKYASDIETLVNLGIMKGYEDGSYRPEQNITRQEFVALVIRLFEFESVGLLGELPFKDVDTWAIDYIRAAYSLKLVDGYDNNTFGPDDNITINQAVKIVVCALGYNEYASKNGGYPYGYNSFAAKNGLTDSVAIGEKEATRGEIASILVNALETNFCDETYSANGKTEYKEGNETLLSRRNIKVIEGTLLSADGITVCDYEASPNEVNISGKVYQTELSGTKKYIGRKVIAYVDDENYVLHISLSKSNHDSLVVYAAEIEPNTTKQKLVYTRNKKTHTEKIDEAAVFVLNGKVINPSDVTDELLNIKDGKMELIDTDNNSHYDIILVSIFDTYIVNSVLDKNVYDLFGKSIDIEEYESDFDKSISIYKNDEPISYTELQKYDVISAAISSDGMYAALYVCDEYIDGKISGKYEEDGYIYYSVDNEEGEITLRTSAWFNEKMRQADARLLVPEIGSEVRAYLNCSGDIAYIECGEFEDDYKYGVLVGAEKENGISSKGKIKLLTLDNSFTVFEINDKIKTGYMDNGAYVTEKLTVEEIVDVVNKSDNPKAQIVRYACSGGELKKLQFADKNYSTTHLYKCGNQFSGYYREGVIDQKYIVNKDTVMFVIPGDGSETHKLSAGRANEMLSNGSRNNIIVYDVRNGIAGAVVKADTILDGTLITAIDKANSDVMLISKAYHTKGSNDDDYLIIEGFVNGKKKAVLCSDTLSSNKKAQSDLRPGAFVQYATNENMLKFAEYSDDDEVIEVYSVLHNLNTETDYYKLWNYIDIYSSNAEICITYGKVNYVYDNHIVIDTNESEPVQAGIELNKGTAVYKYYRGEKKIEEANQNDISAGMEVLVRQRYSSVREVIIVKD